MAVTLSDEDVEKVKKAIDGVIQQTYDGFWDFGPGQVDVDTLIQFGLWPWKKD